MQIVAGVASNFPAGGIGDWAITAPGGVAQNQAHSTGLAERFTVAAGQSITVTALALYTSNAGASNGNATVLIWDVATTNPVPGLSVTFNTGTSYPLVAGTFRAIYLATPIVLGPGVYQVGAYGNVNNYNVGGGGNVFTLFNYNSRISWGNGYFSTTLGVMPNGSSGTSPGYALATFLAV